MNTPTEAGEIEIVTRFLRRFADLMSTGSNAENLQRAAELLQDHVQRTNIAEGQLRRERADNERLRTQLAELSRDDQVRLPASVLRLAASQFDAMAREFASAGNVVSEAMCTASASTLRRALEIDAPPDAEALTA
jgi:hypothetical protein